ncbi:hypothetical protein AB1Y20_002117 [Prymnesium parvum]|uniref:Uncharacterized protein n=1 Tax=Prymnesium parvum TaxID=97485 RepID=A0AB34J876_PRYPA
MSHVGQLAQDQSAPFSSQHERRGSAPPLPSPSAGTSSCVSRPPRASTSAPCSPDAHGRRRLLTPESLHPSAADEALPHPWAEHSARPREGEARTPSPRQEALQALLSRRRERLAGVEGMLVSGAAALFDIDASLRCAASRRRRLLELALSSPEEDKDSDDGEDVARRREGQPSAHVRQPLEEQEPSRKEWDDLQERQAEPV